MIKYFDCSVIQLQNDRLNKIEGTAKTNTVLVDDLKYKEKVSHYFTFSIFRQHSQKVKKILSKIFDTFENMM